MDSILLSFRTVFPLFAMISLGYFLRQINLWDSATINRMNILTFKVFLPTLLCMNIYHTELSSAFNGRLLCMVWGGVILLFLALCVIVPRFTGDKARCGAIIQGLFRGNTVLLGIPVVTTLTGAEGAGTAALMAATVVPLFNALAVIDLELFRSGKVSPKKLLLGIVKNPLIIGSAIGLSMLALRIHLPGVVESVLVDLSKVATPLSLMILGGTFQFSAIRKNARALAWTMLGRLVLVPLVFLTAAVLLGFRGVEIACLIAVFAVPTAASSFTMAQQMDSDYELAGQIVVFSSMLSIVSLFFWVLIVKQLGLI